MCFPMDEPNLTPLEMVIGDVGDLTGLHTATLVERGVTVNGQLADRYRFDPPVRGGTNADWEVSGKVWLAQAGDYIVRYEVAADTGGGVTRWEYKVNLVEPAEQSFCPPPARKGEAHDDADLWCVRGAHLAPAQRRRERLARLGHRHDHQREALLCRAGRAKLVPTRHGGVQ